ncbi:DUF5949 family protein [Streptomyces sp. NPDC003077]|uniref:DUF5949 family protein n=1 Tax=Streptomyces sp. NPDC003077 TaxID=3154443 RepID=UPI0033B726E8
MTSPRTIGGSAQRGPLGTFLMIAWSGEHYLDGRDVAFLLTYSLGDGCDGPEAGTAAMKRLLERARLPIGDDVTDGSEVPGLPVTLLAQADRAVLTLPGTTLQSKVTAEWLAAVRARGRAYAVFTTRPWPQAVPRRPVSEEALKAFATDEEMLRTSAHCWLPLTRLRGAAAC